VKPYSSLGVYFGKLSAHPAYTCTDDGVGYVMVK